MGLFDTIKKSLLKISAPGSSLPSASFGRSTCTPRGKSHSSAIYRTRRQTYELNA